MAGSVKTVSVKSEGRRWFVVLTAEQVQPEPLPTTGEVVGIDLGIATFLADSSGQWRRGASQSQVRRRRTPHFFACGAERREDFSRQKAQ